MMIQMLATRYGSPDGFRVIELQEGKIYDDSELGDLLCDQMVRYGYAKKAYIDDVVRESVA